MANTSITIQTADSYYTLKTPSRRTIREHLLFNTRRATAGQRMVAFQGLIVYSIAANDKVCFLTDCGDSCNSNEHLQSLGNQQTVEKPRNVLNITSETAMSQLLCFDNYDVIAVVNLLFIFRLTDKNDRKTPQESHVLMLVTVRTAGDVTRLLCVFFYFMYITVLCIVTLGYMR